MFIQCQHCQATYKIDEQKIPDQNTFVRCANCNTPISLNKQEQSALSKKKPLKIVDCSSCGTRYSIPLDKIDDTTISVRCGKCSHVFEVSVGESENEGSTDPQEDSTDMFDSEVDSEQSTDDDLDMDNISIPQESEIEVDGLFDDVDDDVEEEGAISTPNKLFDFEDPELEEDNSPNSEQKGPTEAYLDSIDLSNQMGEDFDSDLEMGEISSEEKYNLFLKPKSTNRSHQESGKQLGADIDDWPDIHDETESLAMNSEMNDFIELDDLEELPDSAGFDTDDPLELQEMSGKSRPNRFFIITLLIVLLAILAVSGWFYLQTESAQVTSLQEVENFNNQTRLKLTEPLRGRLVTNENSGEKIFILEGEVRNNYPQDTVISWIEVKGVLFDKNKTALSESTVYAGNILETEKLPTASIEELDVMRQSKILKKSIELNTGEVVPFQILFFNAGNDIQKLQAQISRFARKKNR
ncbi:MAG: zinc-ribbon domain-containing protein [SAR324 cluster bacterium]|nr:zinc-ribbon domain-containing protein [SAR324 cluster bacterium]